MGAAHQLQSLRHLAKTRGWPIAAEYLDLGVRRGSPRGEFERLHGDIGQGGRGVVVATSLSMLFTDQRQAVLFMRDLAARGFDLVASADEIDTTVSAGREFGTVMTALARLDRAALRESIAAGLAEARRQGKVIGRKRVEVPVAQARALLAQGHSLRETGRMLGVAVGTLHRALHQARGAHRVVPIAVGTALQEAA